MKTISTIIGVVMLIMAGTIGYLLPKSAVNPLGSVQRGGEYHSTTTPSGITAGNYTILSGKGVLGSIVVASSSASTFTVLDANGTSTTTVTTLKAGVNENTFTFDRNLLYGLIITVPSGYNGLYTTTYR